MNVAVVKDNVIVNVIVSDEPDNINTFPVPNGLWIGDKMPPQYESIEAIKTAKLTEISKSCEDYIYAGTTVTFSDNTTEHFTYTLADQSNISEMFTAIMAGATEYTYHADV